MSNLSLKQNYEVQIKTSWKQESRKGWEEDRQAKGGMMEEGKRRSWGSREVRRKSGKVGEEEEKVGGGKEGQ